MTRVTFATCIRPVKCRACMHAWGIGCNVHKAGSTYCPKCRATVALGKRGAKR